MSPAYPLTAPPVARWSIPAAAADEGDGLDQFLWTPVLDVGGLAVLLTWTPEDGVVPIVLNNDGGGLVDTPASVWAALPALMHEAGDPETAYKYLAR